MKDNNYLCPKCKGYLNVSGHILFATKTRRNHKGLLMLDPKIGEYKYQHHEKFNLEDGEMVEFRCPICQSDLTSSNRKDHAMITMVGIEDNIEYDLYFSKIAGNQSTYLVAQDNIESFGDDALGFDDIYYE